jgi:hypothetical protein
MDLEEGKETHRSLLGRRVKAFPIAKVSRSKRVSHIFYYVYIFNVKYILTLKFLNIIVFNNMSLHLRVTFFAKGEFLPLWGMFTPSFTPRGEHTLLFRRTKGRTQVGDNFNPGE